MTNQQMPHAAHIAAPVSAAGVGMGGAEAAVLHTAGYLAVTAALALIVYARVGLTSLRRAWVNIDLIWTGLLLLTAVVTPFL